MSRPIKTCLGALAVVAALGLGVALVVYRQPVATPVVPPLGDGDPSTPTPTEAMIESAPRIAETLPDHALWRAVDPATVDRARIPEYKETVEGAVLVAIDDAIGAFRAGDEIAISVPQIGALYQPTIARAEAGLGNNVSYIGRLADTPVPRSFVITVGDRNTFANLSTPEGEYELVGNTELAWLMPVANMDQHVDYSKPDFYLPGQERPGQPNP